MKYNPVECGDRIRVLRESRNYTQAAFSEMLNISRNYLSKIECGVKRPSIELLIDMAEICCVSLDYIILGKKGNDDSRQRILNVVDELTKIAREL